MPDSGERVPVVFFPRFTALTGSGGTPTEYISTPVDMLGFTFLSVTVFRSKIVHGGLDAILFAFEQSTDLVKFVDLGSPFDPAGGPNVAAEINFLGDIFRRYVRLKVTLDSAADNTGTIFAVGWASRTQA